MPKLTDQTTIQGIKLAFEQAVVAECDGYVGWKPVARQNLDRDFPGYTQELIEQLILSHLKNGGDIIRAEEKRPEWRDRHRYHYDFVLDDPADGDAIYVESVIVNDDLTDVSVMIVNCHLARR